MLPFALYWRLNSRQPDPWEGKKWVDTAVTRMVGQGVAEPCGAPQQRDSAHLSWWTQPMLGGMFSVHLTLLFLILWRRMWPGNLWCTPCVKGCAPGPLCESQDKCCQQWGTTDAALFSCGPWGGERWKSTINPHVCSLPKRWFVFAFQWAATACQAIYLSHTTSIHSHPLTR